MSGPLHCAWQSLIDRFPISYDDFKQSIADFEITPIHVQGNAAGALFVRGADIHACVLRQFKGLWFSRNVFRVLNRIIEQHGYVQTSATTKEGAYFIARLGFTPCGTTFRRTEKWA